MSAANAGAIAGSDGLAAVGKHDARRGSAISGRGEIVEDEDDHPVAPDQFDPKYETSKWEVWSYYTYWYV